MHSDIDIIAHRGASGICGEANTMPAFRHAMAMGCEYLETDLHRCIDDEIICFHDSEINGIAVSELTLEEVQELSGTGVPTLTELLSTCGGRIKFDLEIKSPGFEDALLASVLEFPLDDQVIIKSFNHDVLRQLRRAQCPYPIGLLIARGGDDRAEHLQRHAAVAEEIGVDFISPHADLIDDAFFAVPAFSTRPCLVWTVNKPEQARHLLQFPIHGLITDRPDLMQTVCNKPARTIDRAHIEDALGRYNQSELIGALTWCDYQGALIATRCIDFSDHAGAALLQWSNALWGSDARVCVVYDDDCAALAEELILPELNAVAVALQKQAPYKKMTPRMEYGAQITAAAAGCSGIVAIGSGTLNDICKFTASELGMPYIACASAASMNGYTSSIAALLVDELKSTLPCTPPVVVISDSGILKESPLELSQSGYADLLSKFVSVTDWKLSSLIIGEDYDDLPGKVSSTAIDHCITIAHRIAKREQQAIHELMEAIILSGYSMALAGSSAPASGGEHLISHYLDMTAYDQERSPDLHGLQVALGILLSARLYELIRARDPQTLTIRLHTEAELEEAHGPLWPTLRKTACAQLRDEAAATARLAHIQQNWDQIWNELDSYLKPHAFITTALKKAGVACHPDAYDIPLSLMKTALVYAADMRDRYSVLHFARDCGLLEELADEVMATAFSTPGHAGASPAS